MAIVGVSIVALAFAPQGVWDRIERMTYLTSVETLGQSDSSAEQRYTIWQVAEKIIADNPVLGVGMGAYGIVHERYARTRPEWAIAHGPRDTHSTYLHILAESGPLGLLLFLGIFLSAYWELFKTSRSIRNDSSPPAKLIKDRCQIYQSAFIGLSICAVFGSMESMVFPFLLISLAATSTRFGRQAAC